MILLNLFVPLPLVTSEFFGLNTMVEVEILSDEEKHQKNGPQSKQYKISWNARTPTELYSAKTLLLFTFLCNHPGSSFVYWLDDESSRILAEYVVGMRREEFKQTRRQVLNCKPTFFYF